MRVNWNSRDIAWLAGLLEGEGAFFISWKETDGYRYPAFRIAMNLTDEDVLRRAAAIAGVGLVRGPYQQPNSKHKQFWRWYVNRRDHVYALLVAIHQFMGERRASRIREIIQHREVPH